MTPQTINYGNYVAAYQRQQVTTLSAGQLVAKLYNLGIQGCNEKDSSKVSMVLAELMAALNFKYKEVTLGLYKLYDYCLKKVKVGMYNEVSNILKELVGTWSLALQSVGAEY